MRKVASAVLLTVVLLTLVVGSMSAHSPGRAGTGPDDPNCHGVTLSTNATEHGGIPQAAEDHPGATGGTVQGLQERVTSDCADE